MYSGRTNPADFVEKSAIGDLARFSAPHGVTEVRWKHDMEVSSASEGLFQRNRPKPVIRRSRSERPLSADSAEKVCDRLQQILPLHEANQPQQNQNVVAAARAREFSTESAR